MNLKRVLRIAIIMEWSSWALLITAAIVLDEALPSELQNYLTSQEEQRLTTTNPGWYLLFAVSGVVYVISSVALFYFKRWAKRVYVVSAILIWFAAIFIGSQQIVITTKHVLTDMGARVPTIAFGFICALIFFTDVLKSGGASRSIIVIPPIVAIS